MPVLRSPDFPGVAREQAAVSIARVAGGSDVADPVRGRALIDRMVAARVGGTFWAPFARIDRPPVAILRPASGDDAAAMADAALREHAPAEILALLPEAGWSRGASRRLAARGISAEIGDVDPWPLLAAARVLHATGDDELAFLARIAGLDVRCHADGIFAAERDVPVDRLAAAILIDRAAYRDPFTGRPSDAETAIDRLAFWRGCIDASRDVAAGAGIAVWKRSEVEAMLWAGRRRPLRFFGRGRTAVAAAKAVGGAVAVWPSRAPRDLDAAASSAAVPVYRVEDGFIRSVGLGAACHPPLSIALDRQGIHYDPSRPSDLETILATADFPPELTARADALADFIVRRGISKYASGRDGIAAAVPSARRRVLVPGQVEDDLSVRLGGGGVAGNLDLLARVRAAEPHAHLIFKPHPDVVAGHRPGHVAEMQALAYADEIVHDAPMAAMLDQVDAVHVLTSLAGFEALLRGREVVTHGLPFYAGWGLTRDLAGPLPRRGRALTLAELVAGTLILYPRYLDPVTRLPCPPEVLLARLSEQRAPQATWLTRVRDMQGRLHASRRRARSAA